MRTHRKTGKMEKQAANLRARGALPLPHSSPAASCTPPLPPCVLLSTAQDTFQRFPCCMLAAARSKFMQNVLLRCAGNSIHPTPLPFYSTPSIETLLVVRSIKVKFRLQVQVSPSSLARWGSPFAFIDLCFINENNINWIIMNSCESRRMADVGLQIETKLWISLA